MITNNQISTFAGYVVVLGWLVLAIYLRSAFETKVPSPQIVVAGQHQRAGW